MDIETRHRQITSIALSTKDKCLVIPFVLLNEQPYWGREDEIQVVNWLKNVMRNGDIKKIFQNGLYDTQVLLEYGISVIGWEHDSMFAAHALFPEMPKNLGFLASIYTNFPSWKFGLKETKVEK